MSTRQSTLEAARYTTSRSSRTHSAFNMHRDPRAAPTTTRKNITSEETCAFYGIADAISKCRYPRTCQDCLAKPGCVLTSWGLCASEIPPYQGQPPYHDYHDELINGVANYSQPFTGHNFFSANATYCPASDAMCSRCRTEFQQLALTRSTVDSIGSQFCVGANGCVCVAICEVPLYRETHTYDQECGQKEPLFINPNSRGHTLPSFTLAKRDPRSSLQNALKRPKKTLDTCATYGSMDIQGCRPPRTCRDCLAQPDCLLSGHRCTSMVQYNSANDYRASLTITGRNASTYAMFPSSNTTYCAPSDDACTRCRTKYLAHPDRYSDPYQLASYSQFCIGTSACVCIEFCEADTLWAQSIKDTECSKTTEPIGQSATVPLLLTILTCVFLLILYYGTKSRVAARVQRAAQQATGHVLRHMLDHAPAVLPLDLFGWRAFQQRLLAKEHELLQGNGDVSPVAPPPMDFSNSEASAPDFEEEYDDRDAASAPTAIDPRGLASAPVYRLERQSGGAQEPQEPQKPSSAVTSAPDFEFQDSDGGHTHLLLDLEGHQHEGFVYRRPARR